MAKTVSFRAQDIPESMPKNPMQDPGFTAMAKRLAQGKTSTKMKPPKKRPTAVADFSNQAVK